MEMTAGRSELQRVAEEVENDLLQLCWVGVRDKFFIGAMIVVPQLSLRELRSDEAFHLAENFVHHGRAQVHLDVLSAIEANEVENRVDQSQ